MWILTLYDLDTGELESYLEGDFRWKQKLAKAKFLAGHNIVQFDNCILKKLFGFILPKDCGLLDTMIVSLVLNYRRFGENGHSLEVWGDHLGHPKVEHEDWSQYSEEMRHRNVEDVRLNVKVYEVLIQEYLALLEKEPLIHTYLKVEHAVAKWCGEAALHGWPFDVEKAKALKAALEVELNKAYNALSSKLGMKAVPRDKEGGEVAPKRMKWLKDGTFDKNMATFFGVDPMEGLLEPEERDVDFVGEFCRVNIVPLNLGYHEDVKLFLFRNGWVPTEWNFKKDKETGRPTKERSSPKITEDSLDILGGDGKLYPEFLTAKARHGILNTWLEEVDENGMLHGDCFTIGTPSMRARHSIIVNVPSSDAPWGKEMRELFMAKPGWKLLGCDSEGNQARGLAHFLNDDAFTDTLLNGDVHTFNANMLDQVLQGMGISWDGHIKEKSKYIVSNRHELAYIRRAGLTKDQYIERLLNSNRPHRNKRGRKFYAAVKRAAAKRILYAFLFGASGAKLWSYIFDTADFEQGNQLKKGFTKAVPGFTALLDKLARIFKSTSKYGDGYIVSIAGNRIYVDSFHKLLVYLLQSTEKITCGGACMLLMERLEERGIPYIPCIMMHDELVFMVPEEHAEEARQIGKQAFIDGPKLFGVEIMGGSGKIGNNWYEVH
jgi:DNA polymerase I-like protein with 3'-5' exonuclease and polymerase domains